MAKWCKCYAKPADAVTEGEYDECPHAGMSSAACNQCSGNAFDWTSGEEPFDEKAYIKKYLQTAKADDYILDTKSGREVLVINSPDGRFLCQSFDGIPIKYTNDVDVVCGFLLEPCDDTPASPVDERTEILGFLESAQPGKFVRDIDTMREVLVTGDPNARFCCSGPNGLPTLHMNSAENALRYLQSGSTSRREVA